MSDEVAKKGITGHVGGWIKGILGLFVGVGSGVVVMYSNAIVNSVVKPTRPVANFAVSADGLTVSCANHATGDSGWWDFGDGSTLDPFDAGQQTQTHTYAKLGTYSVKLTVRNFMMEENERAVPVDLTTPPKTLPPEISALKVEPLGNSAVAPAGFRISGDVQNAERLIFDLGGDSLPVVETQSGRFEKFVVFDKPGVQMIRLMGLTGTTAVKREASVTVTAAPRGSVSVVVKVTDSGTQVEKRNATSTVSIPLPKKGEARFERPVSAEPGFTIADGQVAKPDPAVVKNVKLELQPDRKSGKLVGDWAATGEALAKAAKNADVMLPLTLSLERSVPVTLPTETLSAVVGAGSQVTAIGLPPRRLGLQNPQRKLELQISRANPDGSPDVLAFEPDLKPSWKGATASRPGIGYGFGAELKGDQLQVRMQTKQ